MQQPEPTGEQGQWHASPYGKGICCCTNGNHTLIKDTVAINAMPMREAIIADHTAAALVPELLEALRAARLQVAEMVRTLSWPQVGQAAGSVLVICDKAIAHAEPATQPPEVKNE